MKFWQALSFTETDQLLGLAQICEEVGFHGAFVSDHVFHPTKLESKYPYSPDGVPPFDAETEWPESFAAISAMGSVTSTLHFTTSVYIATLRHPLIVAKAVATADAFAPGRVALGAGVGWIREEYDLLGERFGDRGRRLDEMCEILRKAWAGGEIEHHGELYEIPPLRMSPTPKQRVPIYIGGMSAPAIRRAARHDGWIGAGNPPEEVPGIVERLLASRREAGVAGDFEVIVALTGPPDVETFRRTEDAGATGIVNFPLGYALGPASSLDQKRAALEGYAEAFIARCP